MDTSPNFFNQSYRIYYTHQRIYSLLSTLDTDLLSTLYTLSIQGSDTVAPLLRRSLLRGVEVGGGLLLRSLLRGVEVGGGLLLLALREGVRGVAARGGFLRGVEEDAVDLLGTEVDFLPGPN